MSYPLGRIDPTTQGRERSVALWRNVPDAFGNDPCVGTLRHDDFHRAHVGAIDAYSDGWFFSECAAAGADTEVFSTTGHPDGYFSLSAATGTDHEGVKMQGGCTSGIGEGIVLPTATTSPKGTCVFEWKGQLDDSVNDTLFIGLASQEPVAGLLSATSTLVTSADHIGFYRLDDGDLQFVVQENAGAVTYTVDVVAAADIDDTAGTQTKLGFRVDHNQKVEVYVNGTRVKVTSDTGAAISVTSTALPLLPLSRTIAVARGATGDNDPCTIVTDWVSCYVQE